MGESHPLAGPHDILTGVPTWRKSLSGLHLRHSSTHRPAARRS